MNSQIGAMSSRKPAARRSVQHSPASSPCTNPSASVYVVPTANDILRGRGGANHNHFGNRRLLDVIHGLALEYVSLKRGDKQQFCREVIDQVHAWGGRFLDVTDFVDDHKRYSVMDMSSAMKLVGQKLRDDPTRRTNRTPRKGKNSNVDDTSVEVQDSVDVVLASEAPKIEEEETPWYQTVQRAAPSPVLFTEFSHLATTSSSVEHVTHRISPATSFDDLLQLEHSFLEAPTMDDLILAWDDIPTLRTTLDTPSGGTSLLSDPSFIFPDNDDGSDDLTLFPVQM